MNKLIIAIITICILITMPVSVGLATHTSIANSDTTFSLSRCEFLSNEIVWYMNAATRSVNRQVCIEYSLKASNYLKLYDLCGCLKHHTSKIIDKLMKNEIEQK